MKYSSVKSAMYTLVYAVAFVVCNVHANVPKQPENIPNLNEPKTFRTGNFKFPENDPKNKPQQSRNIDKEDVLQEIPEEIVEDIMHEYPEIAKRIEALQDEDMDAVFIPKTLLLAGKPGCGKTTIAVAIAQVLNRKVAFFEATSLVGDAYQNSGVNYLEAKLDKIICDIEKNPQDKYVVIIDEVMRLAENHKSDRAEERNTATKLWLIMDKYKRSNRVFFIATANEIDDLPEQIKSRFSEHNIIEVKMPTADYRKKILLNCLGNNHKLTKDELGNLVGYTEGLTHRQIETIVEAGALISLMKTGNKKIITYEALEEAIGKVKDITFVGRWVYDPVNNCFINPANNWIFKPFTKFYKKNQETLVAVRDALLIGTVVVTVVGGAVVYVMGTGGAGVITLNPASFAMLKAALASSGALKGTALTAGVITICSASA